MSWTDNRPCASFFHNRLTFTKDSEFEQNNVNPSNAVQRRDGRTLDGVRRVIPSRLPSVQLVNKMLNGTGTGP